MKKVKFEEVKAASEELSAICQDLFDLTDITFFAYSRFYKSRQFEVIISNEEIFEYFVKGEHYFTQMIDKCFDDYVTGFAYDIHVGNDTEVDMLDEIKNKYNVSHFLGYQLKTKQHCDFFHFGTHADNDRIHNFYLMNLMFFRKFSRISLPLFRRIIKEHTIPRVSIPYVPPQHEDRHEKLPANQSLKILTDLIQRINQDSLTLDKNSISQRELECLQRLLEDKTAKEIAKELHISHRTVEHHRNRIKWRLGISSIKALRQLFDTES